MRTSGGNPQWHSSGRLAGRTAIGPGGAANPTIRGGGLPGYSFDGGDYFDLVDNNTLIGDPAVTGMAWVRTGGTGQYTIYAVGGAGGTNARGILVNYPTAGRFGLHFRALAFEANAAVHLNNTPQFFAFTKSPGALSTTTAKLYINGVGTAGTASAATAPAVTNDPGEIGRYVTASLLFLGHIYEVMEIGRVLSAEEIRWYYETTRHKYGV
jgi:hypothetical protein